MTTLTIELDEVSLARVRELADARNISITEMIRRMVQTVTKPALNLDDLPPITRQSIGILPSMTDEEVDKALDEYRMHKYGRE